jgi:hypothetical protein
MKKDRSDKILREQVLDLLQGGGAHAKFGDVIKGIPAELLGRTPDRLPHSLWMLVEHMRIGQWDILEFSRNPKHVSPKWPEGYWPRTEAPPSVAAWNTSIKKFRRDLKAMEALVRTSKTDLFAPIPSGDGQTVLREALLLADHNAYHLGQMLDVRRLLGAWRNDG